MASAFFGVRHTVWRNALLFLLAWSALAAPLTAQAAGLSPKEEKQIIAVVQAQLNAFAADDAKKAFSFASPTLRQMLRTPDNFMAMVRSQYEVVYRPANTVFFKPSGNAHEAFLKLQLTDSDGDIWFATYSLHRMKNHSWVITGCQLDQAVGTMV